MRLPLLVLAVLLLLKPRCASGEFSRQQPELRGAWIATVENIDWPSRTGLPATDQQNELLQLLDGMQQMHLNAVFFQVRPCGDAFYPSRYAPWSAWLTGTQGKSPGYDPLEFLVREAHRRHLQLHAWFNPFRVSVDGQLGDLASSNPARLHPDWVVRFGGKLYFNPGRPEVRALLVSTVLEVVKNYEIDGVHFDDYFYPYPVGHQTYPDADAYRQYGAATFDNVGDWRRDNVNRLIAEVGARLKAANPRLQFGVSPFGVWRNRAVDPSGSDTAAGLTNYDDLFADTRTWIQNHWIDYIAPQLYWPIGYRAAAYEKLLPWWAHEVEGTAVRLYIGQGAYRLNEGSKPWKDPQEIPNQLRLNERVKAATGSIFFSLRNLLANPRGIRDRLVRDFYREPAPRSAASNASP